MYCEYVEPQRATRRDRDTMIGYDKLLCLWSDDVQTTDNTTFSFQVNGQKCCFCTETQKIRLPHFPKLSNGQRYKQDAQIELTRRKGGRIKRRALNIAGEGDIVCWCMKG